MSDANGASVADLAMLVARLVGQIRRMEPDNPVAQKALDYLKRKNIHSDICREVREYTFDKAKEQA